MAARVAPVGQIAVQNGPGFNAGLVLGVEAGPGEPRPTIIRIDWGTTDPVSGAAQIVSYDASPFGSTLLPLMEGARLYEDGAWRIRVLVQFDGQPIEKSFLDAVFALGAAGDLDLAGSGRIDIFHGGGGNDSFRGGEGDDLLTGGFGSDLLVGGAGDDRLFGGALLRIFSPEPGILEYDLGADTLLGGAGDDILEGRNGDDVLHGGDGTDYLEGGEGHDRLLAGGGPYDTLYGGMGLDTLSGQPGGATRFQYWDAQEGGDRIVGFEQGNDALVLIFLGWTGIGPDRFVSHASAMSDDGPYILYNGLNGALRVDLNGRGPGERYDIAVIAGSPPLTFNDIAFG